MNKPKILIPTPIQFNTQRSYSTGQGYIKSLVTAGSVPLMVPVSIDDRELRELYELSDGILLSGGGDIAPSTYGEEQHEQTHYIDPDRDRHEFLLTRWAVADDKPIFGICRGIQAMNVALGGTLLQDIPTQTASTLKHNGAYEKAARDEVLHHVTVESGSRIEQIMAHVDVGVNSFHHQAVKRAADGFVVTSKATDGIIEGMEMPDKRFAVGVQWHPEEMSAVRPDMLNLFVRFVDAAAGR
ncbi:MAG TPA: gamma-glutamyl-gamma-aminobutyrate hydrolase family protein [Anaerolineae bacterium]